MKKINKSVRGMLYGKIKSAVVMQDGAIAETIPYQQLVNEVRTAPITPHQSEPENVETETIAVELTVEEAHSLAEIITCIDNEPDGFANISGISESQVRRLLSQALKAVGKMDTTRKP